MQEAELPVKVLSHLGWICLFGHVEASIYNWEKLLWFLSSPQENLKPWKGKTTQQIVNWDRDTPKSFCGKHHIWHRPLLSIAEENNVNLRQTCQLPWVQTKKKSEIRKNLTCQEKSLIMQKNKKQIHPKMQITLIAFFWHPWWWYITI